MEKVLLSLAKIFWPQLEGMSGEERRAGVFDVIGVLYSTPLVLLGILWLVAETDLALMGEEWLMMILFFVLQFLFERFDFFLLVETTPGSFSTWSSSFGPVIVWSAALVFGPSALWLFVIWWLVWSAGRLLEGKTTASRWHIIRNMMFNLACVTFAALVALTLIIDSESANGLTRLLSYKEFNFKIVLPAFVATFVWWFLSTLIWLPLFIYYAISRDLRGYALKSFARYWAITTGSHLIVDPFAVLAAGLYITLGLGGFLFFAAGMLIASIVTHQLSRAIESSDQRTREMAKLEALGRSILVCCPDASDLPDALKEHVPTMFPYSQIEIRVDQSHLFPVKTLLRYPQEMTPLEDLAWKWLSKIGEAHSFSPQAPLPWKAGSSRDGLVIAPVLDVESGTTIGGIYLARSRDPDSVGSLLPAVQSLSAQIASTIHGAQIYFETLDHHRVEQELALAGRIQARFLPDELPRLAGWQIAATLTSARETSGDFYDFIPLPNNQRGIVIADVADKGMGAALYMAFSRTLIRSCAIENYTEPDRALSTANRRILEDAHPDMFVTVFYGMLNPTSGNFVYCNAGHNPPFLFHASNSDGIKALKRTGMALGAVKEAQWEQETVHLARGDILVLYTDGVTDAQNKSGEIFGERRLIEALQLNRELTARGILDALMSQVEIFVGDAPQFDDTTVIVLVRNS